jgi:uncharacterized protein involved in outer membrane biogenesis
MKKIKKILLVVIVLVVVLGLAALIVAGLFLDKIVKAGIETVAPQITQTPVTLNSVSLSLLSGSVGLNGLVVGNPSGYNTPSAISIGKAAVSVQPGSLMSDKIIVHSVEINAPEITFEGNPFGDNNLKKIMDNVDAGAASSSSTASTNAAASSGAARPGKKLEVDVFDITGAKVHATITGMAGKEFTVTIPEIHLTDLGKGGDGITAAELTQVVLKEISADAIKAVGDYAKNITGSTANDLIKGATSNTGKAVDQGAATVKKGLGGLLGK